MTTFYVNKVTPQTQLLNTVPAKDNFSALSNCTAESMGASAEHVVGQRNRYQTGRNHQFVEMVLKAFAEHYPLVINPDDIWLLIAQGFAQHVNQNAEKLRGKFVQHEGKEIIRVERDGFVKGSPDNDWQGVFAEFSDKLSEYVGPIRNLMVSDFTTTGPIEAAASEVTLMDAMQSYFDYRVRTRCGIPTITLRGTEEDWINLRSKTAQLAQYDAEWWVSLLLPILDNIIKAYQGNADVVFWQNFVKHHSVSGGDTISGWINAFFPYTKDWQGNVTSFENNKRRAYRGRNDEESPYDVSYAETAYSSGLSGAPFIWEYLGTNIPMRFTAGFMGYRQSADGSLQAVQGWAIHDTKPNPKPEKRTRGRYDEDE